MARKRPLAIYNGILREINKGDTLPPDVLTDTISFGNGVEIVLSQHGDSTSTTFTLSRPVEKVLVAVNGLLQTNYIQPNGTDQLVLGFTPASDDLIIAYCFGETTTTGIATLNRVLDTTTDGTTSNYTLDTTAYNVMVFLDGILQYDFVHGNDSDYLYLGFVPIADKKLQVYSVVGGIKGPKGDKGEPGEAADHGLLTGLGDDDHPQYLNESRADEIYIRLDNTDIGVDTSYHHIQSISLDT